MTDRTRRRVIAAINHDHRAGLITNAERHYYIRQIINGHTRSYTR